MGHSLSAAEWKPEEPTRNHSQSARAAEDERAHRAVAERRMSFMHAAIREKRTPLL